MSKGLTLHLRCFLEGIEVPISSCSVSATRGGPASAHIELLDSEYGFELLPRTMVHVFFFDSQDGKVSLSEHSFDQLFSSADNGSSSRQSDNYKLLFFGEVFSVFHNKSAHGNRSLTIMALDISNVLDTNYIFQVSYSNTDGVLGTGAAAESSFISSSNITSNPFDNIINNPQEVIKNVARRIPGSPIHAKRTSRLGGLFSILELLLGIERYSMGMNTWTTIQERRIRLLDCIESDSGETARQLFNDSVFNEWLSNSVTGQTPSMSYRDMLDLIMGYIYYDMYPIPTASYFKPKSGTGREKFEVVEYSTGVPAEYRDYFLSDDEFTQAGSMDPEFLANVIRVIDNLRDKGYTSTRITSGFRTAEEADALYGPSSFKSPHSKGIAADIDWNDIPNGDLFRLGNVALSKGRSLESVSDATKQALVDQGYIKSGAEAITDARILRFLLDFQETQDWWKSAEVEVSRLLFAGDGIQNTFQFLNYCIAYPLMSFCTIHDREWYLTRRRESLDKYINIWRLGFQRKKFMGTYILGNTNRSMVRGNTSGSLITTWLESWVEENRSTLETLLSSSSTVTDASGASVTTNFNSPGGLTDLDWVPHPDGKGDILAFTGLVNASDMEAMDALWHNYYEEKVKFWKEKGNAVKEVSATNKPGMFSGANRFILSGSPDFCPPAYFVLYDCPVTGGAMGDDPVHIQSSASFSPNYQQDQLAVAKAKAVYDTRERLTAFLVRPDIWMCAPPNCNVIFPEDIVSLNISRELLRQTTRTFLMTYDELYADNVIFNGHYFAPQFDSDLPSIAQKAFGISTSNEVIYPHEVYSGIIPKVNRMSEVAFYSKSVKIAKESEQKLKQADLDRVNNLGDPEAKLQALSEKGSGAYPYIKKYASDVAHFNLMKQRYSANRVSVNARFLPMLVPGLPAVVIGAARSGSGFSSTHTWLGMVESVQHSYSQGGANTAVALGTCRPYKTGDNSIDELLKLKKSGQNLFKNQDPSFETAMLSSASDALPLLTFIEAPTLETDGTTLETLLNKSTMTPYAFPGSSFFLDAKKVHAMLTDICANKASYSKYVGTATRGGGKTALNVTYGYGPLAQPLPVDIEIGYNTDGSVTTNIYSLKTIGTVPGQVFAAEYYTNLNYTNPVPGAYAKNSSAYAKLDSINLLSADQTEVAKVTSELADALAKSLQAVLDTNDIVVEVGADLKKVTTIAKRPEEGPIVATLSYTFDLADTAATVSNLQLSSATHVPLRSATDEDLRTHITVIGSQALVIVPVLLMTESFTITASQATSTATTSLRAKKYRPLEESIMPAWMDVAYKNGDVKGDEATIKSKKAKIDSTTGIGVLYRQWFGCDSVVDNREYLNDEYSTVTIEQAVDSIINKYSSGAIPSTYSFAQRNIATLTDMLAPITDKVGNDIPLTGGFHSRAVGDYDKLEHLGIVGQSLKSSLASNTTVTVSSPAQKSDSISLDPRKERRKRVITYKQDVTKSRGKQG